VLGHTDRKQVAGAERSPPPRSMHDAFGSSVLQGVRSHSRQPEQSGNLIIPGASNGDMLGRDQRRNATGPDESPNAAAGGGALAAAIGVLRRLWIATAGLAKLQAHLYELSIHSQELRGPVSR